MDESQRAHFRAKGWIVVKNVLSAELIEQANAIYDKHLDGSVSAHPEDEAWDGRSYTHYWYNTGQLRPEEERFGRPRILWGEPYYQSKSAAFALPAFPIDACLPLDRSI